VREREVGPDERNTLKKGVDCKKIRGKEKEGTTEKGLVLFVAPSLTPVW